MAITYIQQPVNNSVQASDTPIVFTFSSNQTTQANFCFIVDTLINGVIVSTDKVFPERGTRAHFDASKIALSSIKPNPRSTGMASVQSLSTLRIRVSERYGTTPVTQPFLQSNLCKILKASCEEDKYKVDWVQLAYPANEKWLTDAPDSTMLLSRKYPIWLSILNTANLVQVEVYCYDGQDNLMGIASSGQIPGGDKVNVQISPSDIDAAISPALIEDVARLEIFMNQSDPLKVQYIDEDCGEFHQLCWLNNLGAYDQFLFSHNREQESSITIQEYKKQFGAWSSTNLWNMDSLTSGDTPYVKNIQPSGTLYSGWIPEQFQNWLNTIYESIDAILLETDKIEKIIVTDTKSSILKNRFEEIVNFQVNYKKSNFKSITQ